MTTKVTLLGETDLFNCVIAARTCYGSMENSDTIRGRRTRFDGDSGIVVPDDRLGPKDTKLLKRIIESKHESVLEHKVYTFKIEGFSRAVLQELARHRMASISVRSTRFTLKGMVNDDGIELRRYLVPTDPDLDAIEMRYVEEILEKARELKVPPDQFKHKMPESLKFEAVWTVNARSLRNFFELRLHKSALWEIRKLAAMVYDAIDSHERGLLFGEFGDQAMEILGIGEDK